MKLKEINLENDNEILKFAKDNNWGECKNGCCLFDPEVKQDRTCMAETKDNNIMPQERGN